jgi:hypothetical protein
MLRREGWPDNKKRIHRLYRLEGLRVRGVNYFRRLATTISAG